MAKLFLNSAEQNIVVFKLWQSLGYKTRVLYCGLFILLGLAMQLYSKELLPGVVLVFLGNIFLLPSGYDNRVKVGKFDPQADWQEIKEYKLKEFLDKLRTVKKWDLSSMDISNGLGFFVFLLFTGGIVLLGWNYFEENESIYLLLAVNAAVLLLPYWVTGLRAIGVNSTIALTNASRKVKIIFALLADKRIKLLMGKHDVDYYVVLKGEEGKTQLPVDFKFRVNIKDRHKDFLGLYGQIVNNTVQGTVYPYFYTVMVAKKGFGLGEVYHGYQHDKKLVTEFNVQGDVEVMVIRQNTKKGSKGYYTNNKQVKTIFVEGLLLAEQAAVK